MEILLPYLKDWAIPVLGLVLTVIFGWMPIKKAVGADTERRSRANQELGDLLVRRLILEDFWPEPLALRNIRGGIALKYGLRAETVISDEALRETVIYQIAANDYLEAKRRTELIKRVEQSALKNDPDKDIPMRASRSTTVIDKNISVAVGGLLVSVISALVLDWFLKYPLDEAISFSAFASRSFSGVVVPIVVGGTAVLSALTALLYLQTQRRREALDRVSQEEQIVSGVSEFERRVRDALFELLHNREIDGIVRVSGRGGYDYVVRKASKKILVEVKTVSTAKNVADWFYVLRRALEKVEANEAILVVPEVYGPSEEISKRYGNIKIVTLEGMKVYLRSLASGQVVPT